MDSVSYVTSDNRIGLKLQYDVPSNTYMTKWTQKQFELGIVKGGLKLQYAVPSNTYMTK